MSDNSEETKLCFVIGPIGEPDSEVRLKADWVLDGIIKHVLTISPFEFEVKRADELTDPGIITSNIIIKTLNADLVVADLTGMNPNAFYELAIRHMAEKPVVQIIEEGQNIPFDVQAISTVFYDVSDYRKVLKSREDLAAAVSTCLNASYKVSNPVTQARGHAQLANSKDSTSQILLTLQDQVNKIHRRLDAMQGGSPLLDVFQQRAKSNWTKEGSKEILLGLSARDFLAKARKGE